MKRPITITTGQFGDMPLEELCKFTSSIGYEGLEIACHSESIHHCLRLGSKITYRILHGRT